jgi:hypothetical protein
MIWSWKCLLTKRKMPKVEGSYTNYFQVGQNRVEFVLEFGVHYPDKQVEAEIHTRLITNPHYAKCFSDVLRDAIRQHQRKNGRIAKEEK